jgi:hypothetical protein
MAVAQPLLAGTANVTINGVAYMLQGDLSWSPNTVKQESLTGMEGYHGIKATPVAPFMEFTLRDSGEISVSAFDGLRNATVVAQLANGKTIIGRTMATIDIQEVNSVEATFKLRFEGPDVVEA